MKKFFSLTNLIVLSSYSFYHLKKPFQCSESNYQKVAICILNPSTNSTAKGVVKFIQNKIEEPTRLEGNFTGLKKSSKHGFHIHEFGDLSQGCVTAGAHFNPNNQTHGGPNDSVRHVGDLGNILSDNDGNAIYELISNEISLDGKNNVIGRSCVVHENEDDLGKGNFPDSKTTGHSGGRIACGIIGLADYKKII